ncbi:TetR/AcrR family transcriptional regulator [Glycomyces mayteni]|uniref:TetR/AcrR family transcriptional regulator n=1 Tax=Glycomyces mayteni TaxID=543887 RepID=A0ABW2D8L5_9ACTN|nr:TetR/AcrR family transcriptional regulator [Glycomyces mayteni]
MNAPKPIRADARRNRDALVRAAREIFAEAQADAPFEDVARRAGVGAGTLYRHFPNRNALIASVFEEEVVALRDRARHLLETRPPDEALAAFLREMVDHMYGHRGLARTFFAVSEAAGGDLSDKGRLMEGAVAAILDRGVEQGLLRGDIPVGTLMLALHGIGVASVHSDHRAEADGIVQLLIDGLRRT